MFQRKISTKDVQFLEEYFFYFARLQPRYKTEFLNKLKDILTRKRIIPRGDMRQVSPELELLIGATITMVTFGWNSLRLNHFHTILVYPDEYYSQINQTYHRGEVNPKYGLIILSLKPFLEGFIDPTDGINLGIHEVAHALKLAHFIHTDEEREFSPKAWETYKKWVPDEMKKIRLGLPTVFRERGGVDEHEFFAVVVETFFEKSQEFKAYNPKFYQTMVYLLKQDPLVLLS
ncbi:zinc-dependent peptidase [Algoriphagus mannitolivorans]|uniref:zinc-dependent peptidase n=1 Tax=Algoriphagus mannitolivorans TaxID=226504 RepID=UPI0004061136|nr:zinc-dependent peptidase [Algoriphagus mannitolivorans]